MKRVMLAIWPRALGPVAVRMNRDSLFSGMVAASLADMKCPPVPHGRHVVLSNCRFQCGFGRLGPTVVFTRRIHKPLPEIVGKAAAHHDFKGPPRLDHA